MIIKSYTHEIASRQEFEMVKITDQVQKDVAASGAFPVWKRTLN